MSNTVLIVDDAEFMRVMLKDILVDMGLAVVGEAGDGDQAVAMFRDLQPELVLLDINLPTVSGIDALREIVASDPAADVVMITALGQKEEVLASIKAGARDFIVKPFDQERVQETLSRILVAAMV
jgi:two-component system chemotaxis response regulator CheY